MSLLTAFEPLYLNYDQITPKSNANKSLIYYKIRNCKARYFKSIKDTFTV